MNLNNLTFNLSNATIRRATLHGRPHVVAPMAMLTEGVHSGSGGALYYPADECKRAVPAWNMKPVVVYHPEINGQGVSACDPDILEQQQVGIVMNTRWDGKLRAEAWIEEGLAEKVDGRIIEALEANKVMELSTGLFTDNEATPGTWGKTQYKAIARNHQPDHLALLPDKIGACSVADGAGLLQMNETANAFGIDTAGLIANYRRMVGNAMSHSNIYSTLSRKLRDRVGGNGEEVWLVDVYDGFFIYETGGDFYRLSYTQSDADADITEGEPVEVQRVTEYRTTKGEFVGNTAQTPPAPTGEPKMAKKELVDGLIANKRTAWADGDRETLMAMNEDALAKMAPVPAEGDDEDLTANGKDFMKGKKGKKGKAEDDEEDETKDGKKPTANAAPATMEDFLATVPAEYREVLTNGVAVHASEKAKLIGVIVANSNNKFSEDFLKTKSLDELQGWAALAAAPAAPVANAHRVPMFNGAATPGGPTNNAAGDYKEEPLLPPTMNWDTPAKA